MNIQDYTHLYMGCDFKKGEDIKKLTPTRYFLIYDRDDWKLLLRPLSDMTEEEFKERFYDSMREDLFDDTLQMQHEEAKRWAHDACHYPEDLRWLLSKGFDLFGLIDAGLALDKTTYQSPQSPQSTSTTTL